MIFQTNTIINHPQNHNTHCIYPFDLGHCMLVALRALCCVLCYVLCAVLCCVLSCAVCCAVLYAGHCMLVALRAPSQNAFKGQRIRQSTKT